MRSGNGFGFCASRYSQKTSQNGLSILRHSSTSVDTITGKFSDQIETIFVGFALGKKKEIAKRFLEFTGDIRLGPYFYIDRYSFADFKNDSRWETTFGAGFNLAAEYKFNKYVGFQLNLSSIVGVLSDVDNSFNAEKLYLNRTDLGAGFVIHIIYKAKESRPLTEEEKKRMRWLWWPPMFPY
jgi:hypothetical protein